MATRSFTFGNQGIYWTVTWEPGSYQFTFTGRKQAGVVMEYGTGWSVYLYMGSYPYGIVGAIGLEGDSINITPTYHSAAEEVYDCGTHTMLFNDGYPSGSQPLYGFVQAWENEEVYPGTARGTVNWNEQGTTWYQSCTVTVGKRVSSTSGTRLGTDETFQCEASGQTKTALDVSGYTSSTVPSFAGYHYDSCTSAQITGDTTLYIIYAVNTSQITYYANDPNGTAENMPTSPETVTYGGYIRPTGNDPMPSMKYVVTLDPNGGTINGSGNNVVKNTTRTFVRWNTAANDSGTKYNANTKYYGDADVSLYAIWTSAASIDLPAAEMSGYVFVGWGLSSTATSVVPMTYVPTGTVTLYAIFTVGSAVNIYTASAYEKYNVYIYTGSGGTNGWHKAKPMVYCTANGSTKYHSCG